MQRQLGFNLLEVMVALVILSLGVLGMAKLQMTSIQQNQSAYMRSQATLLAYDIADRMRLNTDALTNYMQVTSGAADTDCIGTAGCSATEMASHDLSDWFAAISRDLPDGDGLICRSDSDLGSAGSPDCEGNSSDNPVVVFIWWDDERDGGTPTQLTVSTDL